MPFYSRHFNKTARFFVFAAFLLWLLCVTGCTTQNKTVIIPAEEKSAPVKTEKGITEESLKCITCHEERGVTHGWIADWEGSKHARKGVGCEVCHISTALEPAVKEAMDFGYFHTDESNCEDKRINRQVIAGTCGKCHVKQYNEFMRSRHSIGWKRILDYGQNVALPKDFPSAKCEQCHNIQFKCDSCHTRHTFNTFEAKTPEACRTCHTGLDHPHYEIYISSKHGAVYTASQSNILEESRSVKSLRSPVCVTCHMPQGNHDVSFGLAYGPAGYSTSYINRDGVMVDETELGKKRNAMLSICSMCHSPNFARKTLTTADTIHKNVESILKDAWNIISELGKGDITPPPTNEMADTALLGHALILGNPQLYSGKSKLERLFYKLSCSTVIAWKGAYHMNPNYTNLYGWVELQKDLSDIKEEARRLREDAEIKRKMEIKLR